MEHKMSQITRTAVLASPLRWQILQMLKSGEALTASQVAAVVQRDFDG